MYVTRVQWRLGVAPLAGSDRPEIAIFCRAEIERRLMRSLQRAVTVRQDARANALIRACAPDRRPARWRRQCACACLPTGHRHYCGTGGGCGSPPQALGSPRAPATHRSDVSSLHSAPCPAALLTTLPAARQPTLVPAPQHRSLSPAPCSRHYTPPLQHHAWRSSSTLRQPFHAPAPTISLHPARTCCRCPKQGQGPLLLSQPSASLRSTKICVLHVTAPALGSLHALPAALLR